MFAKIGLISAIAVGLGFGQNLPVSPANLTSSSGSFLGVGIQEIDSNRAKELKLPEEAGVEVTRIAPDSPAEKAGIKTGDIVVQYNGQRVEGMDQFSRMVRETPAGREVKLGIVRNGALQTVTARIGSRPSINGQLIPAPVQQPFEFRFPDMPQSRMTWRSAMLGIEAETVDGQLADFFGVKEGVLVRTVNKGSLAEKAGLKAGDVIVKVDDTKITTPAELSARMRAARGRAVSVAVVRERKEMTLTLTAVLVRPERSLGLLWPQSLAPFEWQAIAQ